MSQDNKGDSGKDNMVVNGKTVVHTGSGGTVTAKSKNYSNDKKKIDTYTNIAKVADAVNTSSRCFVNGNPALHIDSVIPKTSGDEAGGGGGIYSGTVNGECTFLTASPNFTVGVDAGGGIVQQPILREGDLAKTQGGNCTPAPIVQDKGDTDKPHPLEGALKPSKLTTDHAINAVIYGNDKTLSSSFLMLFNPELEQIYQLQPVDCSVDDTQDFSRKLRYPNLKPGRRCTFATFSLKENGEHIVFPFVDSEQQPTLKNEDNILLKHSDELNSFALTRFNNDLIPDDKAIIKQGGFEQILRLSNELRADIYKFFINYKLTKSQVHLNLEREQSWFEYLFADNDSIETPASLSELDKPWYQLLPKTLKIRVDAELKEKSATRLREGYIYIYLDGYLWRELAVTDKGLLRAIDYADQHDFEARKAEGLCEHSCLLPIKLNDKKVTVEVAFSEVQWSGARIHYFGGPNPNDPHFTQGGVKFPPIDINECKKRREKRFSKLDWDDFNSESITKDTVAKDDQGQTAIHFNAHHAHITIPEIKLKDPLAPITHAVTDIASLCQELEELVVDIQQEKFFNTAVLSYQHFFNYEAPVDPALYAATHGKMAVIQQARKELANNVRDDKRASDLLDKRKIEDYLKVEQRKRLREMIAIQQENLVALLQDKENLAPIVSQASSFDRAAPKRLEAIKDYFSLCPLFYSDAWLMLSGLIDMARIEPHYIDRDLDKSDKTPREKFKPGDKLALSLLEKAHYLYPLLFDEKAYVDDGLSQYERTQQALEISQKNKGDGLFNQQHFALSFALQNGDTSQLLSLPTTQSFVEGINIALKNFADAIIQSAYHQGDKSTLDNVSLVLESLLQKTSSSFMQQVERGGNPELSIGLNLDALQASSRRGIISNVKSIASHHASSQEKLHGKEKSTSRRQAAHYLSQLTLSKDFSDAYVRGAERQADGSYVIPLEHEAAVAQATFTGLGGHEAAASLIAARYKDIDKKIKDRPFITKDLFTFKIDEGKSRLSELWGEREKSPAYNLINDDIKRLASQENHRGLIISKTAHAWDAGSATLFVILSMMNIAQKKRELEEKVSVTMADQIELTASRTMLITALENMHRGWVGYGEIEHIYQQYSATRSLFKVGSAIGSKLTIGGLAGVVGSTMMMGVHIKESYDALIDGNMSKASVKGLEAGLEFGGALAFIGEGSKRLLADETKAGLATKLSEGTASITARRALLSSFLGRALGSNFLRACFFLSETGVGWLLFFAPLVLEGFYEIFKDTELMEWARHSHFGKAKSATDDTASSNQLISLLARPKATIDSCRKKDHTNIIVNIYLPHFNVDENTLNHQLLVHGYRTETVIGNISGASMTHRKPLGEPVILTPSSVSPTMDSEKRVTRLLLTYRLKHEKITSLNHYANQKLAEKQYKVDFKYQLKLKNGDTLPSKYNLDKDIIGEHFFIELDNISGGK